jgi:diguanylate cyclase (GGDEF)-like protein
MLAVDVPSTWVICGAGLLVGSSMMALARSDEARLQRALRNATIAFAVMGSGLFALLFGGAEPGPRSVLWMAAGTLVGTVIFAWAMADLCGETVDPRAAAAQVAGVLTVITLAWSSDAGELGLVYAVCGLSTAALAVYYVRPFVLRPRAFAERALGWALWAYGASWGLRVALTLGYEGPAATHLLHVPSVWQPAYAIFYGVMPVLTAALVFNVVNERLRHHLNARALTDELTGALTRRALREFAPGLLAGAHDSGNQIAVLMIDLDHFKHVNDEFGHQCGDDVLRHAAAALRAQLRPDSLLARFGGEEFVALVPVDTLPTARQVAERLRAAVAEQPFGRGATSIRVTISVGCALVGGGADLEAALGRADEAMYCAKREGRNRVRMGLATVA